MASKRGTLSTILNLDQTVSEFLTHTISTIIGMGYIIFQLLPMLDRRASLVVQMVKNPPATWKTWVPSLDWKDPLEKGMATHSSVLFFKNFKNVYYPFFFFCFLKKLFIFKLKDNCFTEFCWRVPWTEEPYGPQFMGLQRVKHDWVTNTHTSWAGKNCRKNFLRVLPFVSALLRMMPLEHL